jgi:hypothetical protein
MNHPIVIIILSGLIVIGSPMKQDPDTGQPKQEVALPEVEKQYCCACYEDIPDQHSHYQFDADHLVCIHCYFHRLNDKDKDVGLEYVSKNMLDKK